MACVSFKSGLQLRIIVGPGEGEVIRLGLPVMTIGRPRADDTESPGWVFLRDSAVSRQHASLRWDEAAGHYLFTHRSGTNLSWINGEPVTEQPLKLGDVIKIGLVQLEVEEAGPEPEAPQAAPTVEAPPPSYLEQSAEKLGSPKTVALKIGYGYHLKGLDGSRHELTGLYVTVGRGSVQPEPSEQDPNPRMFDQLLELADPAVRPNHLILRWRESDKAYGLFKHPQAERVRVRRSQDGLDWESWLGEKGAVLRVGDTLTLGKLELTLVHHEEGSARKVSL